MLRAPGHARRRRRRPAPARSSRGTCRRASSRSACRRGSARSARAAPTRGTADADGPGPARRRGRRVNTADRRDPVPDRPRRSSRRFFVAAEIALVSIRRSRVEQLVEEGGPGARRVRRCSSDPGRFLAVSQLGLTFIGFLASAYAAVSLADGSATCSTGAGMDAGHGRRRRAGRRHRDPRPVHDRVRRARAQDARPRQPGALRARRCRRPSTSSRGCSGRSSPLLTGDHALRSPGCSGPTSSTEAQITAEELRLIVERGGEQGILEAEEEQMINAVIELGDRRLHEVMVPRIAIVALPASADLRRGDRHGRRRGPLAASPSTRTRSTRSSASSTRRTCCRSSSPTSAQRPDLRSLLRTPVFVPGVDVDRRPPARVPAAQGPHRDRARRVRRHGRPGHDRGPARGDRRRDPGRVRRRGAAGRVAVGEDGARVDGRAVVDDLLELWDIKIPLEDDDEYDTVGGSSTTGSAACRRPATRSTSTACG